MSRTVDELVVIISNWDDSASDVGLRRDRTHRQTAATSKRAAAESPAEIREFYWNFKITVDLPREPA